MAKLQLGSRRWPPFAVVARTRADVGQVLHGQRAAFGHALHKTFAHHVVIIAATAGGSARQAAQMPCGALGPFGLQLTPDAEVTRLKVAPSPLPVKTVVARHCSSSHPKVYADYALGDHDSGCGHVDDDIQGLPPALLCQVRRGRGRARARRRAAGNAEGDMCPSCHGSQVDHSLLPVQTIGMRVVARRAADSTRTGNRAPLLPRS